MVVSFEGARRAAFEAANDPEVRVVLDGLQDSASYLVWVTYPDGTKAGCVVDRRQSSAVWPETPTVDWVGEDRPKVTVVGWEKAQLLGAHMSAVTTHGVTEFETELGGVGFDVVVVGECCDRCVTAQLRERADGQRWFAYLYPQDVRALQEGAPHRLRVGFGARPAHDMGRAADLLRSALKAVTGVEEVRWDGNLNHPMMVQVDRWTAADLSEVPVDEAGL